MVNENLLGLQIDIQWDLTEFLLKVLHIAGRKSNSFICEEKREHNFNGFNMDKLRRIQ